MKAKTAIPYSIILLSVILSYIIFFFLSDEQIINVTLEDHFYEWMGFWFFFLASLLFLVTYILSKEGNDLILFKTGKNIFYLCLALGFFFAAGEEISWGQRVFNFQTSEAMARLNDQEEMNLHNLKTFKGILTFDHIYTAFWVTFCVLIPIINRKSAVAEKFLKRINMPIVPMWLTFFFVLSYTIFLILKVSLPSVLLHAVSEVKETSISEMFFILSLVGLIKKRE